ncbi:hypothetical protein BUALT_Bualt06G0094400 [Buddleja alternifolia]|uniref:Zinc finger GRF-type domain-containing protein n=1 Tax=Buddleja alternifolia TaxID=168488 RepID=A0AAV6XLS8_9LAMI|nr:hypothetical protein BUALT_Bualt06G0094400 [Buddleja alternifolia]
MAEAKHFFPSICTSPPNSKLMASNVNNVCYCMRLAKLKCSWTDANSGRRFYGCERRVVEGVDSSSGLIHQCVIGREM